MKSEEIKELFKRFESIVCEYNGVECWSARELYPLLGYSQWRNFLSIIEKAKFACENAGDRKSTRLNSSHIEESRMPSSA